MYVNYFGCPLTFDSFYEEYYEEDSYFDWCWYSCL